MPKIILSSDGSHTLISDEFNVTYHSSHGSIQESNTVFIHAGLDHLLSLGYEKISVFEMGFGSGLNALMAYLWAVEHGCEVQYTGIEAYPIVPEMAGQLNYIEVLNADDEARIIFQKMHMETNFKTPVFQFNKVIGFVENFDVKEEFDVIFYDAFAPSSQDHLWEKDILQLMFGALKNKGILVTYCAKGAFKRTLKDVGFKIEALSGPVGKREMTRAVKGDF